MGTNFYAIRYNPDNKCSHCLGTGYETTHTHIGKSSGGWTFGFHAASPEELDPDNWGENAYPPINSYAEWLSYLERPGVKIIDEYGDERTLEEFKELVEAQRGSSHNHTTYVKGDPTLRSHADECFYDEDGNSFSSGQFS